MRTFLLLLTVVVIVLAGLVSMDSTEFVEVKEDLPIKFCEPKPLLYNAGEKPENCVEQ